MPMVGKLLGLAQSTTQGSSNSRSGHLSVLAQILWIIAASSGGLPNRQWWSEKCHSIAGILWGRRSDSA